MRKGEETKKHINNSLQKVCVFFLNIKVEFKNKLKH